MPNYEVTLFKTAVLESLSLTIEAGDTEEAAAIAEGMYDDYDGEWFFCEEDYLNAEVDEVSW